MRRTANSISALEDAAMRTDIYQRITDQIIGELEKGVRP
jgi:antirestriction protein ArdC